MQIGGRLPTAIQLHQSFVKIFSKHLAAKKKVSFAFQQKSSAMPLMNPSLTEIVELFAFVELTLVQYATVAGHLPGVAAAAVKAKPKKVNKVEVTHEEPPKGEVQVCAVTPRAKSKGPNRSTPPLSPVKDDPRTPEPRRLAKEAERGRGARLNKYLRNVVNNASPLSGNLQKNDFTATTHMK